MGPYYTVVQECLTAAFVKHVKYMCKTSLNLTNKIKAVTTTHFATHLLSPDHRMI